MSDFVNDAVPLLIETWPAVSVVLPPTGHAHVAAPSGMCAMLIADPAGKFDRFTTKVAVAAVMLPAESFCVTSVIDALPVTTDSALVTGGTSFAGDSWAVNVGLVGVEDEGDVDELQPTATRASATAMRDKRVIVRLSFFFGINRTSAPD